MGDYQPSRAGGAGNANGQVTTMRITDPNSRNPAGYIKYENNAQPKTQGVDHIRDSQFPPIRLTFQSTDRLCL